MDSDSSGDVDAVLAYFYTKNISENAILKASNAGFLRPSHAFDRGRPSSTACYGRRQP